MHLMKLSFNSESPVVWVKNSLGLSTLMPEFQFGLGKGRHNQSSTFWISVTWFCLALLVNSVRWSFEATFRDWPAYGMLLLYFTVKICYWRHLQHLYLEDGNLISPPCLGSDMYLSLLLKLKMQLWLIVRKLPLIPAKLSLYTIGCLIQYVLLFRQFHTVLHYSYSHLLKTIVMV